MPTIRDYCDTYNFVKEHLSKTIHEATKGQVLGLHYASGVRGGEIVICTMKGGCEYVANVTGDSLVAIIADVMKALEGHI